MSKRARARIVVITLAAMTLAAMTAVAHAQAADEPTGEQAARRPPTQGQVGETWRKRPVTSQQQRAADAALQRQLARERFSIPSGASAQAPDPVPPESSGQPGWLLASLGLLAAALALVAGLAVRAAKRPSRRVRAGPAA
jgi:hypothetical protein